jgi:hypothetical protein
MEVCLNLIANGYHIFSYLISKKYRFCHIEVELVSSFCLKIFNLLHLVYCNNIRTIPALSFCCALSSILVACISAIQTCFGLSNSIFLSSHSSISFMEACATNPSSWSLSGWWHRDVLSLGWKSYIFFFLLVSINEALNLLLIYLFAILLGIIDCWLQAGDSNSAENRELVAYWSSFPFEQDKENTTHTRGFDQFASICED